MTCSCPKCNAQIEFDPTDISSDGLASKCAECGANFAIRKESFAKRALHKSDEISCAECGSNPGSSIYCQSCHAIYPDFLVIDTSSAAKRKMGKLLASLQRLKNLRLGGAAHPSLETYTTAPSAPGKGRGLPLIGAPAQLVAVLVVLIVVLVGGGYYWYQDKQETNYSLSFIRALVGVKIAKDFEIGISERLVAAMKSGASASLTPAEQKSATSAKKDVDTVMKRIDNVPKKFTTSNDSLKKLYDSYSNLHDTITSPAASADIYSGAVKKADDDFRKNTRELKAGLPERISTQLAETSKKYKALQDL
jgi:hypothetical protein